MPHARYRRFPTGFVLALLIVSWLKVHAESGSSGRELARLYCSACHLFPEPELLDKKTWRDQTLRRMKIRMGLSNADIDKHPESKLLWATGLFPTSPMISTQEWNSIVAYYVEAAPEKALEQDPHAAIQVGLKHFAVEPVPRRRTVALTTMVKFTPSTRRIYVGDGETQSIDVLDDQGGFLQLIPVSNIPVALTETSRGLYVSSIGHFQPSEDPKGELVYFEKAESYTQPTRILLDKLPRVTHTQFADLNNDGKMDFLMCMYGHNVGRFSWFEKLDENRFEEHVLVAKSGVIRAEAVDLNGDGFKDIPFLMAQESEAFGVLVNDGKGNFTLQNVFQKHPLMGHTYFEMADFNNDGQLDFVVTNGDNGEYASPFKKYHGVRIYLNRGNLKFEEAFFYPINGAFKAMARDFDGDGDLDLAVISFFPDFAGRPEEGFVYLENQGNLNFSPSTFAEVTLGRWLTMDAGDIDGDGDIDLALGSYVRGPNPVPQEFSSLWQSEGPSLLILRNTIRQRK